MGLTNEHVGPKIVAKIKIGICIPSPEQNYFSFFAMRYPVWALYFAKVIAMFFTFNVWLCHFYRDTKVTKHQYECYLKYFCKHTYKGLAVKYSYKLSFISRDFWIKHFNWCNLVSFTKLKKIEFLLP